MGVDPKFILKGELAFYDQIPVIHHFTMKEKIHILLLSGGEEDDNWVGYQYDKDNGRNCFGFFSLSMFDFNIDTQYAPIFKRLDGKRDLGAFRDVVIHHKLCKSFNEKPNKRRKLQ
jgi:hypothetical protein